MAEPSPISVEDYRYDLPEKAIARYPLDDRSASSLLLYKEGSITRDKFSNLPDHLPAGSWLVFNNTRVIQARLIFKKESGARIEIFCLDPVNPAAYEQAFLAEGSTTWHCLVGNVKKWKEGPLSLTARINGAEIRMEALLLGKSGEGFHVLFRWDHPGLNFGELIEKAGSTPIPPYLKRDAEESDRERYQTVYSMKNGSVAAPTAGLHFTEEMLKLLERNRVPMAHITLHVGAGTFVPVKEPDARNHSMHTEQVSVSRRFLEQWLQRSDGAIAVGTTTTRSMESLYWLGIKIREHDLTDPYSLDIVQWDNERLPQDVSLSESIEPLIGFCREHGLEHLHFSTQLMIVPGYRFRTISGLVTNFHMPGSTLLLLVAAWIGTDWKRVYSYALKEKFRFLSYGDSSLLIPSLKQ
jgi:S-adenosylmethionine:tRNA ribosyltransferase-isomerase